MTPVILSKTATRMYAVICQKAAASGSTISGQRAQTAAAGCCARSTSRAYEILTDFRFIARDRRNAGKGWGRHNDRIRLLHSPLVAMSRPFWRRPDDPRSRVRTGREARWQ